MGTIEISTIFSFSAPFILLYNVWLHNQIVKAQIDIAVNNANDGSLRIAVKDIKDDIKAMRDDIHTLANKENK